MLKLLDLFCGAGGASAGYVRAGFSVTGVDWFPQRNYPYDFKLGDFRDLERIFTISFDVIHASPPCQAYSLLLNRTGNNAKWPDLIRPVRDLLIQSGKPYVIENVPTAPLLNPTMYCGSSFGLAVRRHRMFESTIPLTAPACDHASQPEPIDVSGSGGYQQSGRVVPGGGRSRKPRTIHEARWAMGIDWMSRFELAEAIPPAYTEHIGRQLSEALYANARTDSESS